MSTVFQTPTKIIFGSGTLSELGKELSEFDAKKVLLVTDQGLVKAGVHNKIIDCLSKAIISCEIFDRVESDPSIQVANDVAKMAKEIKADALIALGGGSSIDAAKSGALLVANGGYLKDYAGVNKVKKQGLPLVAIPTTAGTGSEVTIFAVMSDIEHDEKFTISSPLIAPKIAIEDPELTLSLPSNLTAYTGMDALTHAVEAYTSTVAQTATDVLAIEAIKMIMENLPVAVNRGDQLKAREKMLEGAVLAGLAFNNAYLGLSHAIASPLGGHFHIAHGLANAVMLPYVMEYNLPTTIKKFAELGYMVGVASLHESNRSAACRMVEAVVQLAHDANLPNKLRDVGAKEEILPAVAKDALKSIQLKFNARKASEKDILRILKEAY